MLSGLAGQCLIPWINVMQHSHRHPPTRGRGVQLQDHLLNFRQNFLVSNGQRKRTHRCASSRNSAAMDMAPSCGEGGDTPVS